MAQQLGCARMRVGMTRHGSHLSTTINAATVDDQLIHLGSIGEGMPS